ncbi:hypothetical protein B484DRAFT_458260 [Ochromonadaceae sp. CCMP2298]|nr:hypothetical protein B484DRAFT_459836 [Ochromonadaceae sp. CCMP2298]KAJ1399834.1 hypothetical protein B484DRAFT_458260 [Ochromonadaceae sp. CCMP2298]
MYLASQPSHTLGITCMARPLFFRAVIILNRRLIQLAVCHRTIFSGSGSLENLSSYAVRKLSSVGNFISLTLIIFLIASRMTYHNAHSRVPSLCTLPRSRPMQVARSASTRSRTGSISLPSERNRSSTTRRNFSRQRFSSDESVGSFIIWAMAAAW